MAGTYNCTLVVNDGYQDSLPDMVVITATENQLPMASFTAIPTSGTVPLTVEFDASNGVEVVLWIYPDSAVDIINHEVANNGRMTFSGRSLPQGNGLLAEYSNGIEAVEAPIYHGWDSSCGSTGNIMNQQVCTTTTASPVDWAWGNFSVTWSGYLIPPETGVYTFRGWVDSEVYVRIGSEVVGDLNTTGSSYSGQVELTADVPVSVFATFAANGGNNNMRLMWIRPGSTTSEVIPEQFLKVSVP